MATVEPQANGKTMPYRVKGKTVEVSRPKGWTTLKVHSTPAHAKKHLAALNTNVRHTTPRKRR
jgi:hypothetical protein